MKVDPKGIPYFIDHTNKTTTYQDPRGYASPPHQQ